MRVFCPEHRKGFFAPRQSPIKCENRGHVLGKLDFEGESKLPIEPVWQYCCNCEHFCPIVFDRDGLERCPVCTRRASVLYLCNHCYTITFESDTSIQTKNFTLTRDGVPQPACPCCLQEASTDLREHNCEAAGISFVTAFDSCPLCGERLDVGPTFPATVASYLRRTKTANKVNVTFDFETELFVPVGDGEFVLVNANVDSGAIVLPRATSFSAKRDFYEFYQDYYHCAKPNAGEIHIIQPAEVSKVRDGWRLKETGVLEVEQTQAKQKTPAIEAPPTRMELAEPEPPREAAEPVLSDESMTLCTCCDLLVDNKYDFCWQCGNRLTSKDELLLSHPPQQQKASTAATLSEGDDEEQTVQHEPRSFRSAMFSLDQEQERKRSSAGGRSLFRLLSFVLVGLLALGGGLFALSRWTSPVAPASAAPAPVTTSIQSDPTVAANQTAPPAAVPVATVAKKPTVPPEDAELKKLKEKRISGSASDGPKIMQTFAKAETKYPNDYRFPYERAKLALKVRQTKYRDEAFEALAVAAVRAIKTGKAHEMLDGLEADKGGDFNQLSRSRREWAQLMSALKSQNPGLLSER